MEYPPDVLYSIALATPYENLPPLCQSSSFFANICQSRAFWKAKAERDLNIRPEIFDRTPLPPRERYLELLSKVRCVIGSERYQDPGRCAAKSVNNLELFNYFFNLVTDYGHRELSLENNRWIGDIFVEAAKRNSFLLGWLLARPDSTYYFNDAIIGAGESGNIPLMEFIYRQAEHRLDLGLILLSLVDSDPKVIQWILNKARLIREDLDYELDEALDWALDHNRLDLIRLYVEYGIPTDLRDKYYTLAVRENKIEIANYLRAQGAS